MVQTAPSNTRQRKPLAHWRGGLGKRPSAQRKVRPASPAARHSRRTQRDDLHERIVKTQRRLAGEFAAVLRG
jgi:hypothetical protein